MKTKLAIMALAGILAACAPAATVEPTANIPAIRTSAAATVVAEFTLTAAAFTPTPLPPTETPPPLPLLPTDTPSPTVQAFTNNPTLAALGTPAALCDDYDFNFATLDVTIVDGTPMAPGQEFVKTWNIRNTGICTWGDGYQLTFSYSNPPNVKMNGQPIPLATLVAPGQEVEVSINFKAPTTPGEYTSYWQMKNPKGITFGKKEYILSVKIVVQ